MKSIKLALAISALALFIIACNDNTANTGQPSNSATGGPTPSASSSQAASGAASPSPAATDQLAHAGATYQQNCAICHGDAGAGGIVNIENKKLKVPSLIGAHALKSSDEHFTKQITEGGEGMPAFKDKLKPEEITEMVRFIRQKLQAGAASAQPSAPNANAPKL